MPASFLDYSKTKECRAFVFIPICAASDSGGMEFIMSVRAPVGAMGKTAFDVVLGRGVAGIKGNEFIYQMMCKMDSDGYWSRKVAGSTFESITSKDLKTAEVMIPNLQEQEKLGNFFSAMDRRIALADQKLASIQTIKKGMLQKIFSQELRFKDDDGNEFPAWKRYTLGNISEIKNGPFGSVLHAEDYVQSGVPIITTEHFRDGKICEYAPTLPQVSDADYSRLHSYILEVGDIVFSRVGSVDVNAIVTDKQSGWLFSGRVLRVRLHDVDNNFMHYRLDTSPVKASIIKRSVGLAMPSINSKILMETIVEIPQSKKEQQKIAAYFETLDQAISAAQKKADALRTIKKGLLQKMFI